MSIYEYYCKSYKVSTDSRQIEPASVFFALKGERFDGNDFALEVAEKGVASLVVADRQSLPDHPRIVKVKDSLEALQGLAMYHRQMMKHLKVIGITGTNGKTTTKELVSTVLSRKYHTVYTQGSLNNHIGVPLTLLRITPDTEFAVVEMGANHPGEIKTLANLVYPDYGIITNVGKAHLEGFGSFEGVIKTKNELYEHLKANNGTAFVNSGNELLMGLSKDLNRHTYGTDVKTVSCSPLLKVNAEGIGDIQTQLIGDYNLENVAAAIAVGHYFDVSNVDIKEALESYQPTNDRSMLIEGRNRIIMDAYNANPTSMTAAIKNFENTFRHGDNTLLILGDFREMGDASEQVHKDILELVKTLGFRHVYLVGPFYKQLNDNPNYLTFENMMALAAHLALHPVEGRTILVKGSHSNQLETIRPLIE